MVGSHWTGVTHSRAAMSVCLAAKCFAGVANRDTLCRSCVHSIHHEPHHLTRCRAPWYGCCGASSGRAKRSHPPERRPLRYGRLPAPRRPDQVRSQLSAHGGGDFHYGRSISRAWQGLPLVNGDMHNVVREHCKGNTDVDTGHMIHIIGRHSERQERQA